ncbi:hypothetical protein AHF37_09211 [Paragonimus kellicotti]|nr:hypothetical protein AHF37_09211 [Paragonimus kellicotti]
MLLVSWRCIACSLRRTARSCNLSMIISRLDFRDSAFSPVWWIPLMIVWFLLLLGTAITIGQLCSLRRDWVYSRWDVQNMLQMVDNTPLVSWTPSKPIPEMPNTPVSAYVDLMEYEA